MKKTKTTWKYSPADLEKLRQMVANGMNRRTAYRKLAKVCKPQEAPAFDYDANTPKGEWV